MLPTLRAERAAGRLPEGAVTILAGWLCHLRGHGAPVTDPRASELVALASGPLHEATRRLLDWLSPELASDETLASSLGDVAGRLCGDGGTVG